LAPALVTDERALAMRAIGDVIAALAVVDQGSQVEQMVAVLGNGAGNQLARLSCRQSWAFF
jgi:hypothetical protein